MPIVEKLLPVALRFLPKIPRSMFPFPVSIYVLIEGQRSNNANRCLSVVLPFSNIYTPEHRCQNGKAHTSDSNEAQSFSKDLLV